MTTLQTTLTFGDDSFTGTSVDDTVISLAGDDYIHGGNGDDTLHGGSGEDNIEGGGGNDTVLGGAGDDILNGRTGDDIVRGGFGDDVVTGGLGADTLAGGRGNDTLIADEDDVLISGGQGFDTLTFTDTDGVVDVDFTDGSIRGIEAIVGDGQGRGDEVNATLSLGNILAQSQDDGDGTTPDTDNTFIAVGIDSITLEGYGQWRDNGELTTTTVDLDATAEAEYLEMLGITQAVDLYAYTFTKANGDSVEIITDLGLDEIFDSRDGEDLSTDIDVV
ncbi:calcium-binding protein [Neptuniibacter marinus]|uniref:calcium-binding protein n=1 Tax=Neptuniibacter marinus TaxID=1806670 RepID=UPI003B595D7C